MPSNRLKPPPYRREFRQLLLEGALEIRAKYRARRLELSEQDQMEAFMRSKDPKRAAELAELSRQMQEASNTMKRLEREFYAKYRAHLIGLEKQ